MEPLGRRGFMGSLALAAGTAASPVHGQAPPEMTLAEENRRLGTALRELNEVAGLGVTPDELERAEAYATGALLEARAKLRPLVLDDKLDVPVIFRARKSV
jgi:hypothetical protein